MSNQNILSINPNWITTPRQLEEEETKRNPFQVDRDRILYSSAFRRLGAKTQVFVSGAHDHLRTRLTHTLEVAQIARTIGRNLELNEDLIEAIAYGHDLGHTPFGHTGEDTLSFIMSGCDTLNNLIDDEILKESGYGFKHNLQSIRVLEVLEKRERKNLGLGVSNFALYGILNHTSKIWKEKKKRCAYINRCPFIDSNNNKKCKYVKLNDRFKVDFYDELINRIDNRSKSFESFVVAISDEIAQRHHDLEDGIATKLIAKPEAVDILNKKLELPDKSKSYLKQISNLRSYRELGPVFLTKIATIIVGGLVNRLIENSRNKLNEFRKTHNINSQNDFKRMIESNDESVEIEMRNCIDYEQRIKEQEEELADILKTRILQSNIVERLDGKGRYILRKLWKAYLTNPNQLPNTVLLRLCEQCKLSSYQKIANLQSIQLSDKIGRARDLIGKRKQTATKHKEIQKILYRIICDHISGMTDIQALEEHSRLYSSHEEVVELR